MDSPANNPIRKAVIEKLIKGKETLLQFRLQKNGPVSDLEALSEVERSFSDTISMLSECEFSQISFDDAGNRSSAVDRSPKGADSGNKRAGFKDRRGCYRRRNSAQSWVEVVHTTEDGFAWRKYGQKGILNTSFPRCYFRCTHKHDQQCKATRQVQRIKESPLTYQITYFGQHTCQSNNVLRAAHQIIPDQGDDPMDSARNIMSFETNRMITTTHSNNGKQVMMKDDQYSTPQLSDVTDSKSWQQQQHHQKLEPSNTANSSGVCNQSGVNDQEVVSGTTRLHLDPSMDRLDSFGGGSSKFEDWEALCLSDDVRFSQFFTNINC